MKWVRTTFTSRDAQTTRLWDSRRFLVGCGATPSPVPTKAPPKEPTEAPCGTYRGPAAEPTKVSGFDYKRFAGETIFASWTKHPITDAVVAHHDEFTELTGINVEYEIVPEQQQRQKNVIQMTAQSSGVDLWESSGFEKPMFATAGWYRFINDWLKDPNLTFPDLDPEDIGAGAWGYGDGGRWIYRWAPQYGSNRSCSPTERTWWTRKGSSWRLSMTWPQQRKHCTIHRMCTAGATVGSRTPICQPFPRSLQLWRSIC